MRDAVDALLETIGHEVAALPRATIKALEPVLDDARRELEHDLRKWLRLVPDGAERFTAQHYRAALAQIKSALRKIDGMEPRVSGILGAGGRRAGALAIGHLEAELATFGKIFQHTIRPTSFNAAAVLARNDRWLVPRFRTSAARYVGDVRRDIQRQLALGVIRGETVDQLKARLIRLGGPRGAVAMRGILGHPDAAIEFIGEGLFTRYGYWAERLARTEVINAYNTHAHEGLREWAAEDDGAQKRWDAAVDARVCLVCRALDGTVAEVNGDFPSGYNRPPAHPQCRCAIVAWHREWTEDAVYRPRPAPESIIVG